MTEQSKVSVGTEYEKFVQSIYQAVLAAEDVENVTVEHNVLLQGRSGCKHQIDIYWEFKLAGQTYRAAIECKAFNQSVSVGRVRDFYGVLIDVPGLTGVFATLIGYQSGAQKYAKHYGIGLRELRRPTSSDWEGRVKDIRLDIHVVTVEVTEFKPLVPNSYLLTLGEDEVRTGQAEFSSDEPILFSPTRDLTYSRDQLKELLPHENVAARDLRFTLNLPDYRLQVGNIDIPITGVEMRYDVIVETTTSHIRGEEIVKAIIRDVSSGELTVMRNNDGVKGAG